MILIKDITDFLDTKEMPYTFIGDSELTIHRYVSIENIAANLISWIKDEKKMQAIMGERPYKFAHCLTGIWYKSF